MIRPTRNLANDLWQLILMIETLGETEIVAVFPVANFEHCDPFPLSDCEKSLIQKIVRYN
jgi:hypothetical protein